MENRETPNERKRNIVKKIRKLRGDGYTLRAIAEKLNGEGEPTLSGRGKWYNQSVDRVCRIDLGALGKEKFKDEIRD